MRLLPCAHTCPGECGQTPCPPCRVMVPTVLPCGHAKQLLCPDAASPQRKVCRELVQVVMPGCSHQLTVRCGLAPEVGAACWCWLLGAWHEMSVLRECKQHAGMAWLLWSICCRSPACSV